MSTQCVPTPRLLLEKVTAATLPEASDEANKDNSAGPLQLPDVSAQTSAPPNGFEVGNPLPETPKSLPCVTGDGVATTVVVAYTFLTVTRADSVVNTKSTVAHALTRR